MQGADDRWPVSSSANLYAEVITKHGPAREGVGAARMLDRAAITSRPSSRRSAPALPSGGSQVDWLAPAWIVVGRARRPRR